MGWTLTKLAGMTFDPASYEFSQAPGPTTIRASTVLPARRENVELVTADGVTLVGELALPESGPIRATLITLHPLPTHGGFMDSHVYRKASYRLPALAGIAVLRFNTRGTSSPRGTSGGVFEEGVGERNDVAAAVRFAVDRGLPNRWLVGWSFGTELALMYGAAAPVAAQIEGAVLLSPPLHRAKDEHLELWAASAKPLAVLVPEHDDFLQPAAAAERFAVIPQARLVGVDGAKHLWVGEKYAARVLNEIVAEVSPDGPGAAGLPTEWAGPTATATN
ncbi:Alpha/beta hydrolase family protein [Arthrobacter ulcerisalmonis]|uniref:Alpha/beta hydrolase family protein n=2 Tax=Arthrobacter ulcerisalmonis TaxID=2483813 RepID=A0A3P5X6A2_9MICC|nr:Alpha/beta hydrolase family protein [Arthrobacter ulcerisalmonis]